MGNERKGRGQRGARRAARCNDGRDERVLSGVQSKESVVRKKRRPSARRATFRESGAAWPKKSAVHGGQRALLSCMLVATALVGSACHGLLRHAAFHASRRSKFGALLTPRFFKVSRPPQPPSIYGSSPRCARAARRARFRAACRFGGGRPAPPYGWDTRAARATHHAPRARTAHHAHRRALHRAPRCTAHHAPSRATLRHAPPVCSSHSWARAAWGRCSQKNAGRPPIYSSCIRWRACLCTEWAGTVAALARQAVRKLSGWSARRPFAAEGAEKLAAAAVRLALNLVLRAGVADVPDLGAPSPRVTPLR